MAITLIKARLAHPPQEDWTGRYFSFVFVGYEDPKELNRAVLKDDNQYTDYQEGGQYEDWYYVNSNGYAQKYSIGNPPSSHPQPFRMILIPDSSEPIYKGRS